jgi:regulator of replication initiation timing
MFLTKDLYNLNKKAVVLDKRNADLEDRIEKLENRNLLLENDNLKDRIKTLEYEVEENKRKVNYFCSDSEVMSRAISINSLNYEDAHPILKKNKDFSKSQVLKDPRIFKLFPEELQEDMDYVVSLLEEMEWKDENFKKIYNHTPDCLKKNKKFIETVVQKNALLLEHMDNLELVLEEEIAKFAIKQNYEALQFLPKKFKEDIKFLSCVICEEEDKAKQELYLKFINKDFLNDYNFMVTLCTQNSKLRNSASLSLQNDEKFQHIVNIHNAKKRSRDEECTV